MKNILISALKLILVPAVLSMSSAAASDGLYAGAAAVNIDPIQLPVLQNGGFLARTGTRVEQTLFARSLVLKNDSQRIAICVVDTCMIDRELCDRAKSLVTRDTGIPANRIMISATHTHSAPAAMRCLGCPADPDYQHFLVHKIAESLVAASDRVRPASAGWGVVDAGHLNHVRRWIYLPHKMLTDPFGLKSVRAMMHPGHANPDTAGPAGPKDPDLIVLSVRDRQGRPLAVLGNFSMHYYGSRDLSSDYTGRVCQLLETSLNVEDGDDTAAIALMSQGTSGDLHLRDDSRPANERLFVQEDDPFAAYCENMSQLALDIIQRATHREDHVLMVRQANQVRVHLDGNPIPEIIASASSRHRTGENLVFGGRGDDEFTFEGRLDEIAVFDRVLDATDATPLGELAMGDSDRAQPMLHSSVPDLSVQPPHVLFIGVDDLRPELGCYGADYIHSPNIDQLAREGVLFERAYCQWAVCMPSRASLLSGLRPDTFQGKADRFRSIVPDVVTLPQHFKHHQYFTQSFGKIYHGAWETAYVGSSFQDPPSWSAPRWASSPQYYFSPEGMRVAREIFATAPAKFLFLGNARRDPEQPDQWKDFFVRGWATEAPDVADDVPADGQIASAAIARMRELVGRVDGPPFFLAVGFHKPHLPFVTPLRYWDLYDEASLPPVEVLSPPEGAPSFALGKLGELSTYSDTAAGKLTAAQIRRLRHGYAACVSYVDAQVGRLLGELDALGIRDHTIVVLWSDHGYKLGDLGAWCKHTNFELDTRVPLIISAPGKSQGGRCEALVELVDLHPTLSELAGLPIHPGAEGVSFAGLVQDPAAPGEDAAFSQYPRGGMMGYSVRTSHGRYTEWRQPTTGRITGRITGPDRCRRAV